MSEFSDEFLGALGGWQRGWNEDKSRRQQVTVKLIEAISQNTLPLEAVKEPPFCYRKRFLIPFNSQNGGDLWPLFWDGEIIEGVASWTTDCDFAKNLFKRDLRPNSFAAIFRRMPSKTEVVLNIPELWKIAEFRERVDQYVLARGENFEALDRFKASQSEIILNAPLTLDNVFSLCEKVPDHETICTLLRNENIDISGGEDEVWSRMTATELYPTNNYWLEQVNSQKVLDKVLDLFKKRHDSLMLTYKLK